MGKLSFIVGAGVGYVFGTRAGRARYEKLKHVSSKVWDNPRVQQKVHKVEEKVGDMARERGAQLTDKVADTVKSRFSGGSSSPASGSGGVHSASNGTGPMDPPTQRPHI